MNRNTALSFFSKPALFILFTLFLCFAFSVSAENSGNCGDSLTWTLDDEGSLTISGTGRMYDYDPQDEQIDLEVAADNASAQALYLKCGFQASGRRLRALKFDDGSYHDEVIMTKLLP